MNKKDMSKIQACVLRVNIHCDGCAHEVKKKLQKIEGVYKVSIDVEQGKVTVSGNVDPATLLNKLEKAGKHAQLWGGQKVPAGSIPIMNHQFKNLQMQKSNGGKDGKGQKGGKGQQKGGFLVSNNPKEMQMKNEFNKNVKFSGKDKKSVKFSLPEDEEEDDDDDDDYFDESDGDDYDDGFEDEFDEGFAAHQPPSKAVPFAVHGGKASKATSDGHQKGKNNAKNGGKGGKSEKGGGGKGDKGEKSGRFDMFLKSMLGKGGGAKTDSEGKNSKKGDKQKGSGKNNKKNNSFPLDEGKNAKNGKGTIHGGGGKMNENWNKKLVGENFNGFPKFESKHPGFNNMNMNPGMMGQMPNFQGVQGLPTGGAINHPGHFPGVGQGNHNPYNNPQYMDQMRMMMMMNQQQQQQQYGNGYPHGGYNHNLGYNMGMNYGAGVGQHPGNDQYAHMFSDENTDSCSIM